MKSYLQIGKIPILAFSFGMASIIGQVALLREFMSLFSGHEIIIGVFLSFWMLFVGLGAFSGRRAALKIKSGLLPVIMGGAFILGLLILYFSRNFLVIHGTEPEFRTLLFVIAITLIPLCLIIGFAFTRYSVEESADEKEWSISKIYFLEQLGSTFGGVLLYIILVRWLDSIQIVVTVVFFLFLVSIYVSSMPSLKKGLSMLLTLMAGITFIVLPIQKMLRGLEFKSEKIVDISDTPYGNVIVTRSDGQTNIYENGSLRSFSNEVERTEEDVHAIMMRHPAPHKILMLGGASQGTFHELKKYGDVSVDYVDIDPAIIDILKKSKDAGDVRFFTDDPLRFLKKNTDSYDVIILNTGLPQNLQGSRFYSKEFFELAKKRMAPGGIIGVKGPEKQFHKEDSYVRYLSIIAATGLSVFQKYEIYPGNNIYFLFTDGSFLPLFDNTYSSVIKQNIYFNQDYILPDLVDDEKMSYIKAIKLNVPVNTCLNPVLLQQSIEVKSNYWQINSKLYIMLFFVLFVFVMLYLKKQAKAMAVTGFALSGIQLVLIFLMQIVAGNVYQVLGLLFALSMAGMALGSYIDRKYMGGLKIPAAAMMIVAGILILLLPYAIEMMLSAGSNYTIQVVLVYFLVMLFSFMGGVLFSMFSYQPDKETGVVAGSVYGADLLGSSAGILITSLFLIPVAGMVNTIFLLGVVCVVFAMLFLAKI